MANTLAPFGFVQYNGTGSVPTYEQVSMKIASNNSTAIFFGDAVVPVIGSSTGYIKQATTTWTSPATLAGVFVGCKYLSTAQKRVVWSNYWPGSDATGDVEAYVVNDPNAQFKVQAASGPITAAMVGNNVNIDLTTSGNTSTGISGMAVSGAATTATLPFRIVSLLTTTGVAVPNGAPPPGSNGTDSASAYNYVVVAFNNIQTRSNAGVSAPV